MGMCTHGRVGACTRRRQGGVCALEEQRSGWERDVGVRTRGGSPVGCCVHARGCSSWESLQPRGARVGALGAWKCRGGGAHRVGSSTAVGERVGWEHLWLHGGVGAGTATEEHTWCVHPHSCRSPKGVHGHAGALVEPPVTCAVRRADGQVVGSCPPPPVVAQAARRVSEQRFLL